MSKKKNKAVAAETNAPAAEPKVEVNKVAFDAWFALRSSVIPAIHKKEIIHADFKARKVPVMASIAEFDEALRKYGIKLA